MEMGEALIIGIILFFVWKTVEPKNKFFANIVYLVMAVLITSELAGNMVGVGMLLVGAAIIKFVFDMLAVFKKPAQRNTKF